MQQTAIGTRELAAELGHALERHQLSVHYQPITDLTTGAILEVEALARWVHPRWGPIPPAEFIPVAEQSELILAVGQWILEAACRQVRAWQLQFPDRPPLIVNVNLSAKQVQQPTLVDTIRRTLRETGLNAGSLQLEVTESLLLQEAATSLQTLRSLRKLGVAIAIDDFGTGYSALSYLRWLPATLLKLDRSFIRGLGRNPYDTAIVRGVIAIAKELGLTVTGEGIETEEQCALLRSLGCDQGQGYYLARPLPPAELDVLLRRKRLPAAASRLNRTGLAVLPGSGQPDHRNVLVVDDDDHIRSLTSLALEMEGYDVVTASHGTAALEQIRRQAPEVILLDMRMPIMDGWTFSRAYRELPGPHAPIVVLTAGADADTCAAQIGASAYLAKPFDVGKLLTTISGLVASNHA